LAHCRRPIDRCNERSIGRFFVQHQYHHPTMFKFSIATGEILAIDVDGPEDWGMAMFDLDAEDPTSETIQALQGYGYQGHIIDLASVTPNDIHSALTAAGIDFAMAEGEIDEYPVPME
jgi:hypothetical protein